MFEYTIQIKIEGDEKCILIAWHNGFCFFTYTAF